MSHDLFDPVLLLPLLAAAGAAGGLIAGLLGVGGGIVVVPVVYSCLPMLGGSDPVRMHTAIATSLASIVVTSAVSMRAHRRRGAVDDALLRRWAPWVVLGVMGGTALAGMLKGSTLSLGFAVFLLAMALQVSLSDRLPSLGGGLPGRPWLHGAGMAIGAVASIVGIGGGTLVVPYLGLFRYPIHRAIGTASALGLLIGAAGTVGFVAEGWGHGGRAPFSLGYVNLPCLAMILPTSMLCAPLGARLAHHLDKRVLRLIFVGFLLSTGLKMLISAM